MASSPGKGTRLLTTNTSVHLMATNLETSTDSHPGLLSLKYVQKVERPKKAYLFFKDLN